MSKRKFSRLRQVFSPIGVPAEYREDAAQVQWLPGKKVSVSGVKRLLQYTEQCISVRLQAGEFCIEGERLRILRYRREVMVVVGIIYRLTDNGGWRYD